MVRPANRPTTDPARPAPCDVTKRHDLSPLASRFRALLGLPGATARAATGPQVGYEGVVGIVPGQTLSGSGAADRLANPRPAGEGPGSELDPLVRSLALPLLGAATPAGMMHSPGASPACASAPAASAETALLEAVVERIAWGGDRRRGVARIELGGALAGTSIVVHGEGREVALRIELGRDADARTLPERLTSRLRARGLTITEVEVA